AMLGVGLALARYVRSTDDFFLAGRSLNRWVVCGSVMATNVAAVYLVGPAGNAYSEGAQLLLLAWTGNMTAAISAVTFVPYFRRLRVTTISELLASRYGRPVAVLVAGMWIVFYALFSGVNIFTCATVLTGAFDWTQHAILVTVIVAAVVIAYCLFSGLLAVAYTDLLQAFLIILGAVILLPLGLKEGGGLSALLNQTEPDKWALWRPPTEGYSYNYRTMLMFTLLGLPYWFTSQYLLQRSFAGKNVREASYGLLLAALFTGPLTFCYIIPAMAARLSPNVSVAESDQILSAMIQTVIPVGLAGVFLAALVAASNSTASSYLNSIATLLERDIYRPIAPDRAPRHYVRVGRLVTVVAGLVGLGYALWAQAQSKSVLDAAWALNSIFQPPIFVVVLGALFFTRATLAGGVACLVVGVSFGLLAAYEWFGPTMATPESRTFYGFPICGGVLVFVSLLTPPPKPQQLEAFSRATYATAPATRRTIGGLIAALLCLAGFVLCAFYDAALPKPANVLLTFVTMIGFILGMYVAAPMFLPAEEEEASDEAAPIERSLLVRGLANGKTWALVFAVAIVLVVVLSF
ncbi:MAG TPA: sodium/solute symporter, partial [Mycobacterium sp.]